MNNLVLSIFPGIDLLGRAFEEEGYCVVRGPDVLWGGDVRTFHPPAGVFGGVIGGPPCQFASRLRNVVLARGATLAENRIPEFLSIVDEAQPAWWLMENVTEAPEPSLDGYAVCHLVLHNRWLGEEQHRKRRFSFGTRSGSSLDVEVVVFESARWSPAVCASGSTKPGAPKDRQTRLAYHGWKTAEALRESLRLQGLPSDFCDHMPFTLKGKHLVIGNGVPVPMGRAIAKAVRQAAYSS